MLFVNQSLHYHSQNQNKLKSKTKSNLKTLLYVTPFQNSVKEVNYN